MIMSRGLELESRQILELTHFLKLFFYPQRICGQANTANKISTNLAPGEQDFLFLQSVLCYQLNLSSRIQIPTILRWRLFYEN